MDVSIIIVNWNVREFLTRCVKSIIDNTHDVDFEIIVVDNASNDGSTDALRHEFNQALLDGTLLIIENKQNLGFSRGNNIGLKEAKGKYILFLNPDTEFTENTLLKFKEYFDNTPEVSTASGKLIYPDKSLQPNVKRDPDLLSQVFILLKIHHFWQPPAIKRYLAKDFDYQESAVVEQIMGAFIFIRRELIDQLHGWNEDYWLWWEDVDLCTRIRQKGGVIMYQPISEIIHYESKSFAQVLSFKKQKRFIKGMLRYFAYYKPFWQTIILALFVPISLLLSYITQTLKIGPRPQSRI